MSFQALRNFKYTILDAVTLDSDRTSERVNIELSQAVAVQFVWSSGTTPVGVMHIEVSNDGTNFVSISNAALSGNSGTYMFNIEEPAYSYIRAHYVRTSGSATLTAVAAGKAY